jgi:hypothetical protein
MRCPPTDLGRFAWLVQALLAQRDAMVSKNGTATSAAAARQAPRPRPKGGYGCQPSSERARCMMMNT